MGGFVPQGEPFPEALTDDLHRGPGHACRGQTLFNAAFPELSTGQWLELRRLMQQSTVNTRYSGFLLTRPTDSGMFSSAPFNGLE